MPQELPPLPFGDIAAYKRARKGSGLSDEELLEEQAGMERRIAKKAARRGVTLIGAGEVKRRNVAAAVAAADAVAAAAAADAAAAGGAGGSDTAAGGDGAADAGAASVSATAPVSATASVSAAVTVSSRGRPLIERRQWPEDDA